MTLRPGPVLGRPRRRRAQTRLWSRLALLGVLVAGGWLWVREIGGDLAQGELGGGSTNAASASASASDVQTSATRVAPAQMPAAAAGASATAAAASQQSVAAAKPAGPAGPAEVAVPRPATAQVDPVARALLAAGRDHVARGVRASRGSVPDLRALKGNGTDLIERGLARIDFPLRAAIIAHRAREPRRYGLKGRPAGEADPGRVLDQRSLTAFLDGVTARVEGVGDHDLVGGDVVVVEDSRGRAFFAIVSDRTADSGATQLYALDTSLGVARGDVPVGRYQIRVHWRLRAAELRRARRALGLAPASLGAAG